MGPTRLTCAQMRASTYFAAAMAVVFTVGSCGSDNGSGTEACTGGDQCACYPNGTCNAGLECMEGACVANGGTGNLPGGGAGGVTGGSGGIVATGGRIATGGTAGAPPSCTGCGANQVCVGGSCVDVPNECPCPMGSYCDLATNRCSIGCVADEHCDVGQICDTAARMCRAGCRDDASCGPGFICENLTCRAGCRVDMDCSAGQACVGNACAAGCRTSDECTVSGATCVGGACQCGAGESPCNGTCVNTDTSEEHCGECNVPCTGGTCSGGSCSCAPDSKLCGTSCRKNLGESCSSSAECCDAEGEVCFTGLCRRPYQQCASSAECGPDMCYTYCTPSCSSSCPQYVDQSGSTHTGVCAGFCFMQCTTAADCPAGATCPSNACTFPN